MNRNCSYLTWFGLWLNLTSSMSYGHQQRRCYYEHDIPLRILLLCIAFVYCIYYITFSIINFRSQIFKYIYSPLVPLKYCTSSDAQSTIHIFQHNLRAIFSAPNTIPQLCRFIDFKKKKNLSFGIAKFFLLILNRSHFEDKNQTRPKQKQHSPAKMHSSTVLSAALLATGVRIFSHLLITLLTNPGCCCSHCLRYSK